MQQTETRLSQPMENTSKSQNLSSWAFLQKPVSPKKILKPEARSNAIGLCLKTVFCNPTIYNFLSIARNKRALQSPGKRQLIGMS